MRLISTLCALALLSPAVGLSQTAAPQVIRIGNGSRVRIAAPVFGDKKRVGTVESVTHDTLVVRQGANTATSSVATTDITSLEVSRGTHTRKAKGALWGTVVGAGIGGILGYSAYRKPTCDNQGYGCINLFLGPTSRGANAAFSAFGGGIVGALIGTLVGSRSTDTWVPGSVSAR